MSIMEISLLLKREDHVSQIIKLEDPQQLKKVLCFKYIPQVELNQLVEISEVLAYQEGETIVQEGEDSLHFFAVLQGTVTVHVEKKGEGDVYLCSIGEGEVFGEAGIFMKMKRTATIKAAGETKIFRIHRHQLIEFIKSSPSSGVRVLMIVIYGLLRKLRESNQELAYERRLDADQLEIDSMVDEILKGSP